MSLKRQGKNKPNALADQPSQHVGDYPTREELISQLSQLRSSLDGAYETLDSLTPSSDPDVIHKVADMVDIINGLHECEFELMDLLAKDRQVINSPHNRAGENAVENGEERLGDGVGAIDNVAHSRTTSQEDLSLYGAYAVASSRSQKNANGLSRTEKSTTDNVDSVEGPVQIPAHERADYIRRLEDIQKVNERLVDRCRRLGLVLRCGFALDKNFTTKMKEVKDIIAAKEQAQKKILELKALMQQVTDDKLDTDISLAKIENDESFGRAYRFESRLASRGASSVSPVDQVRGSGEDENLIKKPRSYFGAMESSAETNTAPDYAQFLRGLHQPFSREHGERESAFVPIHNASHHDLSRDKNKRPTNLDSNQSDVNNEVKHHHLTVGSSGLFRRVVDKGSASNSQSQNMDHWEQQRLARSSSARASLASAHQANGCASQPNNLYRPSIVKSPPSMQSSSGMGSMNSRSVASLENCRNDMSYMSRMANRNAEPEDNVGPVPRVFPEGSNMASNNLNKSYRQSTRSSSFYSELDFRNQEFQSWEDDRVRTTPMRSPTEFSRLLSSAESQQITDELNRVLRYRKPEDTLPQQNWWSSSTELGQSERHTFLPDHHNFLQRGKASLNEKQPVGNSSFPEIDPFLYDQFPTVTGQRNISDCYTQIMQLHLSVQEISQQIRNLTMAVAANKTATRDALLQHRFDLHNMIRSLRDVPDMISESMKRIETQIGSQSRMMMDIDTRLRRLEDTQRLASQKYGSSNRESEWQVPGRPDFMISQDLSFQYGSRDAMRDRDRDNGSSGSMLNNQIPPGTRANNYWDNFRSYSRQNMLSKSNANVPQTFSHEASPSSTENSRYSASEMLNNTQPLSVISDCSLEGRRNGNGGAKNLWATSGFYENMSSKKRNKDQKSQSTSISSLSKPGGNTLTNCSAPEPLRSSRESQPEPDDSNSTTVNRQQFHSRLSPQMPPYRRSSETGPFSRLADFELPWPPEAKMLHRDRDRDLAPTGYQLSDSTTARSSQHQRDIRFEENNPNSQSSEPKIDCEKHIQNYEARSSDSFLNLDDTRSTNQELLDNADDSDVPDWRSASRHNESSNTIEGASSAGDYRSPLSSPLMRPVTDNNRMEQIESNNVRIETSPTNLGNSSTAVAMNIRCEEGSITPENTLLGIGRMGNRGGDGNINNI